MKVLRIAYFLGDKPDITWDQVTRAQASRDLALSLC